MEHQLIAYYEQRLDASRIKAVEQWLRADIRNEKMYEEVIRVWQAAKTDRQYLYYNKEQAWERLQQQIAGAQMTGRASKPRLLRLHWAQISAAAALVLILGLLLLRISRPEPAAYIAKDNLETITLKDGSRVALYPQGGLQVEKDFNKDSRTVTLKGDAYFDIARNPEKPFIIHNDDMEVQVLGTSFTIQQRADRYTVFVHTGRVEARYGGQTVTATAHQKIIRDLHSRRLLLEDMEADIDAVLKSQTIQCKDMRIDSLARILKEVYYIDLQLGAGIAGKRITSTYLSYETPEQVVQNIALTINASWSRNGNHYIITK
ncbi:FecR family protein [Niabella beijingensis]|uniref:FecR family protein n=1 Tax=Niabella beijingensis TaxID=2872700 RepID=UPI001CBDC397|nr:FecR domain-containing protein [Niabella beijingensis]MBZ4190931.1 FecR domain-containing protein [Niabella beijingensis]